MFLLPHNFPRFTLFFLVLKVFLSSPPNPITHFHTQTKSCSPSMADSRSYTKTQFSPQELQANPSMSSQKSYTHIVCKSLVFVFFLVAIPLFPSQAPEFINHTVFTKLWELFHLLFIGLAVCYGLFSRRNVEADFEPHSSYFDDSQSSFVSRIFHVSPIFEDGSETQSGFDEKYVYQTWNSQFSESMVNIANESTVIDEQSKTESFLNCQNGIEIPLENDENNVVQAWNSQYFHGESVVVVSQPNYAYDEFGKPRKVGGYQPLGLPVRALNSRIGNPDSSQLSNGSESGSSLIGSSSSSPVSREEENGDMGSMNLELEEKFDENVFFPSQNSWRSRSGRPEFRDRIGTVSNRSHFRPLSVDETQFDYLKSQSFRSTASLSSQASSMSNSPNLLSPSHSSCSDSPGSRTEESGKVEETDGTHAPASLQPAKHHEARLNAFHLRRYSSGSLFQKDTSKKAEKNLKDLRRKRREISFGSKESGQGSVKSDSRRATIMKDMPRKAEDDLNDLRRKRREDSSGSKESVLGSLKSDTKPAAVIQESVVGSLKSDTKPGAVIQESVLGSSKSDTRPAVVIQASSRGKSVRTIRSGGAYASEAIKVGEMSKNHVNDKVGKGYDEAKTLNIGKNEMKREGLDGLSSGLNKKKLDSGDEMAMPNFQKFQQREKEEVENTIVESEQESESEIDDFQPSSSNDVVTHTASDANEVDKKAGEFIAKFREQIRLQKVASMERSKDLRMSGKYLR